MEFEYLEFWWEFCVIFRHFFCGVVGTEKNLVGEGYNEEHHILVSHANSLCVFFFQNLYLRFRNDFSIPTAYSQSIYKCAIQLSNL